jgi:hypothetical protein
VYVEKTLDGAMVLRPGVGRQRLLVATSHPAEVVVVCDLGEVVSVVRHFDDALKKTVPCSCSGPCHSQRLDRFLAVLYRQGPTLWDERVLVLPANGWGSLVQTMLNKHLDHSDIRGLRAIVQRRGDSINGRTTFDVQDRVSRPPKGFDLIAGIRNCTGIAADFFGDADGDMHQPADLDPKPPSGKPRIALGKKQGR